MNHDLINLAISTAFLAIAIDNLRRQSRDTFRCDIRRLRDELFDFVLIHGGDFSDPEYVDARESLNGMLRLSEKISFFRMLIIVWHHRHLEKTGRIAPDKRPASKNPELSNEVRRVLSMASARFVGFSMARMLRFMIGERQREQQEARAQSAVIREARIIRFSRIA